MKPENFSKLQALAFEKQNALLHALIQMRVYVPELSDEDWFTDAILQLAKSNSDLRSRLVDAEMRAPAPPLKLGAVK